MLVIRQTDVVQTGTEKTNGNSTMKIQYLELKVFQGHEKKKKGVKEDGND